MELRVQGFELVLQRGRARAAMEFAHRQDLIQPPRSLGTAQLLGVASVLMSGKSGLVSAMFTALLKADKLPPLHTP